MQTRKTGGWYSGICLVNRKTSPKLALTRFLHFADVWTWVLTNPPRCPRRQESPNPIKTYLHMKLGSHKGALLISSLKAKLLPSIKFLYQTQLYRSFSPSFITELGKKDSSLVKRQKIPSALSDSKPDCLGLCFTKDKLLWMH